MTRLENIYVEKVAPELKKEFGYTSSMQIPRLSFVSLNMWFGRSEQQQ
jgi:large subunit ribosomal protein L5